MKRRLPLSRNSPVLPVHLGRHMCRQRFRYATTLAVETQRERARRLGGTAAPRRRTALPASRRVLRRRTAASAPSGLTARLHQAWLRQPVVRTRSSNPGHMPAARTPRIRDCGRARRRLTADAGRAPALAASCRSCVVSPIISVRSGLDDELVVHQLRAACCGSGLDARLVGGARRHRTGRFSSAAGAERIVEARGALLPVATASQMPARASAPPASSSVPVEEHDLVLARRCSGGGSARTSSGIAARFVHGRARRAAKALDAGPCRSPSSSPVRCVGHRPRRRRRQAAWMQRVISAVESNSVPSQSKTTRSKRRGRAGETVMKQSAWRVRRSGLRILPAAARRAAITGAAHRDASKREVAGVQEHPVEAHARHGLAARVAPCSARSRRTSRRRRWRGLRVRAGEPGSGACGRS